MRTGKLPEHTLKRSILNPIRYRSKEIGFRAAIGHDGAVFGNMVTSMATTAFCYALDNAINNIIAAGGKPYGVSVAILMPEHSEEATLRAIMDRITRTAEKYQIDVMAGHTELVPSVSYPTITVTAYGTVLWNNQHSKVTENMDIVMTKWVGLYGGAILAQLKQEELATRYPLSYVKKAAGYMADTSLMPELSVMEAAVAENPDCILAAHDVSNGGIFGALWQMLSACNCGARLEVQKMPVVGNKEWTGASGYIFASRNHGRCNWDDNETKRPGRDGWRGRTIFGATKGRRIECGILWSTDSGVG